MSNTKVPLVSKVIDKEWEQFDSYTLDYSYYLLISTHTTSTHLNPRLLIPSTESITTLYICIKNNWYGCKLILYKLSLLNFGYFITRIFEASYQFFSEIRRPASVHFEFSSGLKSNLGVGVGGGGGIILRFAQYNVML